MTYVKLRTAMLPKSGRRGAADAIVLALIFAADDERLPKEAVLSLYRSAKEPKELIWLPGAHVTSDADVLRSLVDMVMSRIAGDS